MRATLALLALMALYPTPADACSCIGPQPACAAVWTSDAVFSGTVLRITSRDFRQLVTFRVDRMWRSNADTSADTLEIETGIGGGDCGFPFRMDRKYLVYASKDVPNHTGRLSTGICSNTRDLDHAGDDIAFLKSLEFGGQHSRIWGQVRLADPRGEWTPLAGVAVDLHRGDDIWTTTSDDEGRFEFVDLPPALYHVFARDYLVDAGFTSARIAAPSACAELTLFVKRPPGP
jgi:hypothetical protein